MKDKIVQGLVVLIRDDWFQIMFQLVMIYVLIRWGGK
mgnify:CR=1 FL=1